MGGIVARLNKAKILAVSVLTLIVLACGVLGFASYSAYAEEIDIGASYKNYAISTGDSESFGWGGTLGIKKNDAFMVHAACIESAIPAPTQPVNSTYADRNSVDKNINNGKTLSDEKIEKIKKIIYVYSETNKLDGKGSGLDKYQAAWAAIAKVACGQLPPHAYKDANNQTEVNESWSGKTAYDYLMKVADGTESVTVPSGMEPAFFESEKTPFGQHKTQTLVALKLYGSAKPSIKNTTVTAKVGATSSTATDSTVATATLNGTNSASLSDKIELENLDKTKTYKLVTGIYKVENGTGTLLSGSEQTFDISPSGDGTASKTVSFSKKLSEGGTYTIVTKLYEGSVDAANLKGTHNGDYSIKTETVEVTKTETSTSSFVDIKISKNSLGGSEVAGAKMKLSGGPDNINETWTSTTSAKEFSVRPGKYTLVEEVAPAGLKRVTTTITFTVAEDGSVELTTTSVDNGGEISVVETDGVMNHIVLEDAPTDSSTDDTSENKSDDTSSSETKNSDANSSQKDKATASAKPKTVVRSEIPRTGDESRLAQWLTPMLTALAILGMAGYVRKRTELEA